MKTPDIKWNLNIINPVMEEELRTEVYRNLEGKMESSLKKIYSRGEDVEVIVRISVEQVSDGYNGSFKFEYDGESLEYSRDRFEKLLDLVNHAFDNFKQRILAK